MALRAILTQADASGIASTDIEADSRAMLKLIVALMLALASLNSCVTNSFPKLSGGAVVDTR